MFKTIGAYMQMFSTAMLTTILVVLMMFLDLIDLDQKEVYHFINPKVGGSFAFDANNRLFLSAGMGNRACSQGFRKLYAESTRA